MDKIRHLSPLNLADAGQFRPNQPVPSVGFYPLVAVTIEDFIIRAERDVEEGEEPIAAGTVIDWKAAQSGNLASNRKNLARMNKTGSRGCG